jgi:hypothetical protein
MSMCPAGCARLCSRSSQKGRPHLNSLPWYRARFHRFEAWLWGEPPRQPRALQLAGVAVGFGVADNDDGPPPDKPRRLSGFRTTVSRRTDDAAAVAVGFGVGDAVARPTPYKPRRLAGLRTSVSGTTDDTDVAAAGVWVVKPPPPQAANETMVSNAEIFPKSERRMISPFWAELPDDGAGAHYLLSARPHQSLTFPLPKSVLSRVRRCSAKASWYVRTLRWPDAQKAAQIALHRSRTAYRRISWRNSPALRAW